MSAAVCKIMLHVDFSKPISPPSETKEGTAS